MGALERPRIAVLGLGAPFALGLEAEADAVIQVLLVLPQSRTWSRQGLT
jgi:hypothetical protein